MNIIKKIQKKTIYQNAINEGKWNIKYGKEGTSFSFYVYENIRNKEIEFIFPDDVSYIVSRNILKRFYDENPQIKIVKFNKDRLLIPLSICDKVELS